MFSILNMKLLSERIQLVMRDARIGQSELVEASGASYSVVGQWISGDIKSINLKFALGIERKYGFNHIWLMINEGSRYVGEREATEKEAAAIAARELEVKRLQQLLALYEAATDNGRDRIMSAATNAPKRSDVSSFNAATN